MAYKDTFLTRKAYLDFGNTGKLRYYIIGEGPTHTGVFRANARSVGSLVSEAYSYAEQYGWTMFWAGKTNPTTFASINNGFSTDRLTVVVLPVHIQVDTQPTLKLTKTVTFQSQLSN